MAIIPTGLKLFQPTRSFSHPILTLNKFSKAKPNTTACKQGSSRRSAILCPTLKQTPRGVHT